MQRMQAKPVLGVVFDANIGRTIDDVLALALLFGADGKNESRMLSISLTNSSLQAAAFCDALGRLYLNAAWGSAVQFVQPLAIGLNDAGSLTEDSPTLMAPLSRTSADGKPVYSQGVRKLNDTAEPASLIRNALSAQVDQNAVVVLAGPATNLARLLDLRGAKELIAAKVRFLAISAGTYPDGAPEFNIKHDIGAARKLFAEWPTPIVAAGAELGEQLQYPGAGMASAFEWTPDHLVVDAYRAYKPMPYDAPAPNLAAALYAVRSGQSLFRLSEPGRIEITDAGATRFAPAPNGRHRYLIADPAKKAEVIAAYAQLVSAKPEQRTRRFRPAADDVEKPKPEPPKPAGPAPKEI